MNNVHIDIRYTLVIKHWERKRASEGFCKTSVLDYYYYYYRKDFFSYKILRFLPSLSSKVEYKISTRGREKRRLIFRELKRNRARNWEFDRIIRELFATDVLKRNAVSINISEIRRRIEVSLDLRDLNLFTEQSLWKSHWIFWSAVGAGNNANCVPWLLMLHMNYSHIGENRNMTE